jgi:hypothetical protein
MPDNTPATIAEIREALAKATGGDGATLQKLLRAKEILSQSRPEPVIVYPQPLVHRLMSEHQDALDRIEALEREVKRLREDRELRQRQAIEDMILANEIEQMAARTRGLL